MTGPLEKDIGRRTKKTRAALAEARQRAMEAPAPQDTAEVFVIRIPGGNLCGWEIRQFGGVVLERGAGSFATAAEAQAEGKRALADRFSATSDGSAP